VERAVEKGGGAGVWRGKRRGGGGG